MKLVAHRGLPQYYPENTLLGFEKAIEAGADAIECDVQFNAEGTPYLLHDHNLLRTAGINREINELNSIELDSISVDEAARFGKQFYPTYIEPLSALVPLLSSNPGVLLFLEIKKESLAFIDRADCVKIIHSLVEPVFNQVVIISYDWSVLIQFNELVGYSTGLVLDKFSDSNIEQAKRYNFDYLICDVKKIPDDAKLDSSWLWMVYDLVDFEAAQTYSERGVDWIETWDVTTLRPLILRT